MKRKLQLTIEILNALLLTIIYIIVNRDILPSSIFLIIGSIYAIYNFPIKLYFFVRNEKDYAYDLIYAVLSAVVISMIIALSIIQLFLPDGKMFTTTLKVLFLINSILLIVFVLKKQTHSLFWIHIIYSFLAFFALYD